MRRPALPTAVVLVVAVEALTACFELANLAWHPPRPFQAQAIVFALFAAGAVVGLLSRRPWGLVAAVADQICSALVDASRLALAPAAHRADPSRELVWLALHAGFVWLLLRDPVPATFGVQRRSEPLHLACVVAFLAWAGLSLVSVLFA